MLHIEVTAFQDVPGEQMSTAPSITPDMILIGHSHFLSSVHLFIHSSVVVESINFGVEGLSLSLYTQLTGCMTGQVTEMLRKSACSFLIWD